MKRRELVIEGVRYHRYVVRFKLASGARRQWVRWSPGPPWVYSEVAREIVDRYGVTGIAQGSCTIREAR